MENLRVRVWDKKKKKLYKWGFTLDPDGNVFSAGRKMPEESIEKLLYIGYEDKEDVPIFEGDILEDIRGSRAEVYSHTDSSMIFSGFSLRRLRKSRRNDAPWDVYEVSWLQVARIIGTRYENPELLEND